MKCNIIINERQNLLFGRRVVVVGIGSVEPKSLPCFPIVNHVLPISPQRRRLKDNRNHYGNNRGESTEE